MSKTSNYELEPTELYSLAGPAVPSRMMDELAIYTAVSKPTKNVMTSQLQQPPLDDEIPQQQQQPTPNEKPHQQPQQIVPHQEPVKKTQNAIIIVMLLLILLALGVLLILVAAVFVTGSTCGDTTAGGSSGGYGDDEVNQILQIVRNISRNAGTYHDNLQHNIQDTTDRVLTEELKAIELLNYTSTLIIDGLKANEEVIESSTQMLTNHIFNISSHLENTTTKLSANVVSQLREILDVNKEVLENSTQMLTKHIFNTSSHLENTTTKLLANVVSQLREILDVNKKVLENSTQMLTKHIFNTSYHLENTTTKLSANVVSQLQEILDVQNKLLFSLQPISCKSIKLFQPNSPTGYYHVNVSHPIFCNMGKLCGSGGGWTRLAYLNMTDDTENCPSGFRLYEGGGIRACGRPNSNSGSCSSVKFPSNGISYSEICGRVVGYQYGVSDAVLDRNNNNITGAYVDGVSITRGSSHQHVWTLMAGGGESGTSQSDCPCNSNPPRSVSSLIGSHYYCESGNPSPNPVGKFYPSDPLWDGKGCDSNESSCCSSSPDLPWFHRDYGNTTTTDYIELRVCGDEGTNDEDVPVGLYEIYVKQ